MKRNVSINTIREAYMIKFGIPRTNKDARRIKASLVRQLVACKSDCARRLILGVSQ